MVDTQLRLDDISPIERELAALDFPATEDVAGMLKALPESDFCKKADLVFAHYPAVALISARSRTVLHALTRLLKPKCVLEIGTYKAGSSEIIARALRCNGKGILLTVDPFGQERIPAILETWPEELRNYVQYLPVSSMDCFIDLRQRSISCDLLFIDGDHSYEYALYDLQMGARHITPGGVVVMDNAEQTGVYWAVKAFLSTHPGWRELGTSIEEHDIRNPYHTMKSSMPETSFLILQAPQSMTINQWPYTFEMNNIAERGLAGFTFAFNGKQGDGMINAKIFFRSFMHHGYAGEAEEKELIIQLPIRAGDTSYHLKFPEPFITRHIPEHSYRRYDLTLNWIPTSGCEPLSMAYTPLPLKIS